MFLIRTSCGKTTQASGYRGQGRWFQSVAPLTKPVVTCGERRVRRNIAVGVGDTNYWRKRGCEGVLYNTGNVLVHLQIASNRALFYLALPF